jgi:hypothetical protein
MPPRHLHVKVKQQTVCPSTLVGVSKTTNSMFPRHLQTKVKQYRKNYNMKRDEAQQY